MQDRKLLVLAFVMGLIGVSFAFGGMLRDSQRQKACVSLGKRVVYGYGYMGRDWRCESLGTQ